MESEINESPIEEKKQEENQAKPEKKKPSPPPKKSQDFIISNKSDKDLASSKVRFPFCNIKDFHKTIQCKKMEATEFPSKPRCEITGYIIQFLPFI